MKNITINSTKGAISWQQYAEMSIEQREAHEKEVEQLKASGEFGKPTSMDFVFQPHPEFDSPVGKMEYSILIPQGKFQNGEKVELPKLRLKDFGIKSSIPEEND